LGVPHEKMTDVDVELSVNGESVGFSYIVELYW
jgi:hypothetical protein